MHVAVVIIGSLGGVAAGIGLLRRYVIRPVRRGMDSLRALAEQIRAASRSAQDLAGLSGAVTQVVVAFAGRLEQVEQTTRDLDARQDDTAELVVELAADVRRLQKAG